MQDNIARTGSNWTGRTPRTTREAFPQYPDSHYKEPPLAQKIADAIVLALVIAAPFAAGIAIGFLFPAQGWI